MSEAPPDSRAPGRIRVLRVIARLNIGGPALHAVLLTERLDPRRYDSCLVSGRVGDDEGDYLALHGHVPANLVSLPSLGRDVHGGRSGRRCGVIVEVQDEIR